MQLLEMFYDEIQDAVDRKVPFVIPIGTMEYHAKHASCGTDTLVVTGCLRELEKEKEIVVCPPKEQTDTLEPYIDSSSARLTACALLHRPCGGNSSRYAPHGA